MNCSLTNGQYTVDISPFIAFKGFVITRHDVEGQNGGVTIDGTTIRDVLATKRNITVTCLPMVEDDLKKILRVLEGDGFYCEYSDVLNGSVRLHMHSNEYSWTTHRTYKSGDWYSGFSFTMEEF